MSRLAIAARCPVARPVASSATPRNPRLVAPLGRFRGGTEGAQPPFWWRPVGRNV